MKRNLTDEQQDFAIFLPALSSSYASVIGRQQYSEHFSKKRIPACLPHGLESLNYLNKDKGIFTYKWSLYSAGHASLDITKFSPKEGIIVNRDRDNTWMLGDSGGFQIGKGVWEGDWKNPACPRAKQKREWVLSWMDKYMDYGMTLDIPAWVRRDPVGSANSGINTYMDAVNGTYINNDYFINNRNGNCKFLNVLQGENHTESDDWYERMKHYCDPAIYPTNHFNGWSMGGQNMCDLHLIMKRIVTMKFDNMLQEGVHDFMHFLGTSKLEWALLLTDIQRAVRKHVNSKFTVTFDCATPFISPAKGQIYATVDITDRGRWKFIALPHADDKKYANDTRLYRDVVINDGILKAFDDSPVTEHLQIKDICHYGPGMVNKRGDISKSSWDTVSYTLQQGHNVWSHINACQEANKHYDAGHYPAGLISEDFDRITFRDVVDEIMSIDNREDAMRKIEEYSFVFMRVVGMRGLSGKKSINASTHFAALFDVATVDAPPATADDDDDDDTRHVLDDLIDCDDI